MDGWMLTDPYVIDQLDCSSTNGIRGLTSVCFREVSRVAIIWRSIFIWGHSDHSFPVLARWHVTVKLHRGKIKSSFGNHCYLCFLCLVLLLLCTISLPTIPTVLVSNQISLCFFLIKCVITTVTGMHIHGKCVLSKISNSPCYGYGGYITITMRSR